uniref:Synaptonemal complex central element protein 1 n=1 Tax=Oncorhynchus mykiss TaxID=8022 RepID=A0A8C7VC02_ONCMY
MTLKILTKQDEDTACVRKLLLWPTFLISCPAPEQVKCVCVLVHRQQQLNRKSEDLIEQYRCQIQETKLKHRKHRMKFENHLQQLIEQHKNLHSVFSPDRLPAEIESVENAKSQLLKAEQLKLSQLCHLEEALDEARRQTSTDTADKHTD